MLLFNILDKTINKSIERNERNDKIMPRTLTSKIILCKNIKLDKKYVNVLNYTEQQMLSLCRSQGHIIREVTGYSFIRNEGIIQTNFTYNECLQGNYIAFQNPDYSNKWFFAFIDDVKYISDNNTEIHYSIDIWSTFFGLWTAKPCFVVREHVNDDTIGLHTVPENVELGEYIDNMATYYNGLDDVCCVLLATETPSEETPPKTLATNFGGIPMGGVAYISQNMSDIYSLLQAYAGQSKSDAVYCLYMIPSILISGWDSSVMRYNGQNSPVVIDYEVDKPTALDGYVPKNNKLFTYPYSCLVVDNNNGSTNVLKYEYFSGNKATFKIKGVPTVGGSIKCIPFTYNRVVQNEEEGIVGGKFPVLNWSSDEYLNWQTQQAVNLQQGLKTSGLQILGGTVATAVGLPEVGANLVGGGIGNLGATVLQHVQAKELHELTPNSNRGNSNSGNINVCSQKNGFFFYNKSVRSEYAKIIDDYFTRVGYQVNELKLPNLTGRQYFNYIQIADSESIGYGSVPSKFMDVINNVCRRGVTIWHNHDSLGDYSVNNDII